MVEQYKVKLLPHAVRDLDCIYKYIAQTLMEPKTALNMIKEIENSILSLDQFPNRYPLRKTGAYANKGYRQLLVKNCTVIYRVDEEAQTVVIVTVRYSASQF